MPLNSTRAANSQDAGIKENTMKITLRLFSLSTHWRRTLCRLACGALALTALQAQAYTCGFNTLFYDNISIPVIGPGMSTVGEDVPVGQVLYTGRFFSQLTNDVVFLHRYRPRSGGRYVSDSV